MPKKAKRGRQHSAEYLAYLQSPAWRDVRRQVFARAFGLCELCDTTKARQVHHLTYARLGHEDLADLKAVCQACHQHVHHKAPKQPKRKRSAAHMARVAANRRFLKTGQLPSFKNPPMPSPKSWDFRATLLQQWPQ